MSDQPVNTPSPNPDASGTEATSRLLEEEAAKNAGLFCAALTPLSEETAGQVVGWLLGEETACPLKDFAPDYAVIQATLSLVWAVRDGDGWSLASSLSDEMATAPLRPARETLKEARLFGRDAEALVWRTETGFAGRILRDGVLQPGSVWEPLERIALFQPAEHAPMEENEFGEKRCNNSKTKDRVGNSPFFLRVLQNGRVTVTPDGRGVRVKEYVSEDGGALRIAATRFVEVV